MHGTVMPVSYCGVCHADLWLSGVVSSAIPGQAVCPEHTTRLSADPSTCTLMFRHSVEELQRLLFEAAVLFPGCADDIRAAQQRVRTRPVVRGLKSLGPLMELQEELPAPRAPELKPGGREPATPVAGMEFMQGGLFATSVVSVCCAVLIGEHQAPRPVTVCVSSCFTTYLCCTSLWGASWEEQLSHAMRCIVEKPQCWPQVLCVANTHCHSALFPAFLLCVYHAASFCHRLGEAAHGPGTGPAVPGRPWGCSQAVTQAAAGGSRGGPAGGSCCL